MDRADYTVEYRVSDNDESVHHDYNNDLKPILTVSAGDVVRFECRDAADGQVTVDSSVSDFVGMDLEPVHPLTGPVRVDGIEPGDVLQVDILNLQHKGWGYTGVLPGDGDRGLVSHEFPDGGLHIWDLEDDIGRFVDGIEVPLDPFPGNLGLAPAEEGTHDTTPPRSVGGNLDLKHLTRGSTLYLPAAVPGGLFSIGDCHAAQGDGEVCVIGIEAPMFVTVRFDVREEMDIDQPQFETMGPFTPTGVDGPTYGTTGVSDDLKRAAELALEHMIDHLHERRDLTRSEAYILCYGHRRPQDK